MKLDRCRLASLLAVPVLAVPLFVGAVPSRAQDYDRPSQGYGDDQGASPGGYDRGPGADASDPGAVTVRVGKLENRIREMTGQIEELQNANRKLVEQLQKFQQDVDSRLASGSRARRSEASPPPPAASSGDDGPAMDADGATPKPTRKGRHDDAFDPDASPSDAPGKPKQLGSVASNEGDGAPMDLSGGRLRRGDKSSSDSLAPTLQLPSSTPKTTGGTVNSNGTIIANASPTSPRAEFDQALGFYKGKQYEDAEKGFTSFIQKNPKSRLAADATYYLGESFAQRGRSREAAEQYLKVSTDFANSSRAPDAMLHLGMSLRALGAKEQACATFTEVGRKYPNAPAYVKSGAEREAKRAQCTS